MTRIEQIRTRIRTENDKAQINTSMIPSRSLLFLCVYVVNFLFGS
jgi:hypothetical protein